MLVDARGDRGRRLVGHDLEAGVVGRPFALIDKVGDGSAERGDDQEYGCRCCKAQRRIPVLP